MPQPPKFYDIHLRIAVDGRDRTKPEDWNWQDMLNLPDTCDVYGITDLEVLQTIPHWIPPQLQTRINELHRWITEDVGSAPRQFKDEPDDEYFGRLERTKNAILNKRDPKPEPNP